MALSRRQSCCNWRAAVSRVQSAFGYGHTQHNARSFSTHQQQDNTASFGFTDVPRSAKQSMVGDVFHRVATTYDTMNDLMSVGVHRLWKQHLIAKLHVNAQTQLIDVAGGTGDIAFRVIDAIRESAQNAGLSQPLMDGATPEAAHVTVCDINASMLKVGKERAIQYGYLTNDDTNSNTATTNSTSSASTSSSRSPLDVGISFVECNAESLPFADNSFDIYTIAFGLRNVTNPDVAIREAYRVLRRGGRFVCLEFTPRLEYSLLQTLYSTYSFNIIPLLGQVVANDRASYQYLVESIAKWKTQDELKQLMNDCQFQAVSYENLTFGICSIHSGYKL